MRYYWVSRVDSSGPARLAMQSRSRDGGLLGRVARCLDAAKIQEGRPAAWEPRRSRGASG